MCHLLLHSRWWQKICSATVRVGYLALLSSIAILMLLIMVHRYIFRLFLSRHTWLYASPLTKLPVSTKIWIWIVRSMRGKRPLLFSYQGSLPHLPVPKLEDTVKRYLDSVQPVLGGSESPEYITLRGLADEFVENEGQRIQQYLRFKSLFRGNYVRPLLLLAASR